MSSAIIGSVSFAHISLDFAIKLLLNFVISSIQFCQVLTMLKVYSAGPNKKKKKTFVHSIIAHHSNKNNLILHQTMT